MDGAPSSWLPGSQPDAEPKERKGKERQGRNGKERDGMGWDGKGWMDGMGWEGMDRMDRWTDGRMDGWMAGKNFLRCRSLLLVVVCTTLQQQQRRRRRRKFLCFCSFFLGYIVGANVLNLGYLEVCVSSCFGTVRLENEWILCDRFRILDS